MSKAHDSECECQEPGGDCCCSYRAEIERLRGLLRELINAQNWLFDSTRAEDLDKRVREALGE